MKKRFLLIGLVGLSLPIGAWFLSPELRAAGYDALVLHAPEDVQLWAVDQLEDLGGAGDLALLNALRASSDGGDDVARAARAALSRRQAIRALTYGLQDKDPVIRLRASQTVSYLLDKLKEEPVPSGGGGVLVFGEEEPEPLTEEEEALVAPLIPVLATNIEDPEPLIREESLSILSRLPRGAASATPKMIAALKDGDTEVRKSACRALEAQGDEIWPLLIPVLEGFVAALARGEELWTDREDGSEAVAEASLRSAVAGVLTFEGPEEFDPLPWMLEGLKERRLGKAEVFARLLSMKDQAKSLRGQAAACLVALGEPGFRAMLPHLRGPSEDLVSAALIQDLPAGSSALLAPVLVSELPEMRARGLEIFLHRSPEGVAEALVSALDDPDRRTRLAAIAVAKVWGKRFPQARAPLLRATQSRDAAVRIAALRAYGAYGPRSPERLAALGTALDSFQAGVRAAAAAEIAALDALGPEAAARLIPRLFENLEDEDRKARERAFDALLAIGAPAAPRFLAALKSPEFRMRARAATALGVMTPCPAGAKERLRPLLKDESALVREKAAWALGEIGASDAATLVGLRALLKDPEELVRQAASDALDLLGA